MFQGSLSFVLFAFPDFERKFLYPDIGMPEANKDESIFANTYLKRKRILDLFHEKKLNVFVNGTIIRQYIVGDEHSARYYMS